MTPEETEKLLKTIHTDVHDITVLLKGYNGQRGLVKQVENNTRTITLLKIVLAIIITSVGGGAYGIVQVILGG